jgi:DNA-binding NtrC family response regulator
MAEAILFVDDEPLVVDGFRLLLSQRYHLETATSGAEALTKLRRRRDFAVIVCDQYMPGMDGVQLLYKIRIDFPEVVRIMLTGAPDRETAMHAVNEGHIFRFLTKPCSTEVLTATLDAALIRYRTERQKDELLEKARYGHHLEPWTADPTSPSFQEVEERVRDAVGSQARTFQPSEGCIYIGKAIWVSSDYVVQCLTPTRVVVHPRGVLNRIPEIGEFVTIEYSGGQAGVTSAAANRF